VRFLIDAQLPPALARYLRALGHETEHVADAGLAAASDKIVWNHAIATQAVLVSKDEDFVTMRALAGAYAPPIVWVRLGNVTTRALIARLASDLPTLIAALEQGEAIVQLSD
jgi:predicted nuclease of predicted toxin-antitoxin system